MAVLPLRFYPDAGLGHPTTDVTEFGPALHTLLADMAETMAAEGGIGLAANQLVGVNARALVLRPDPDAPVVEMINPAVTAGRGRAKSREGCLSFPGAYEWVERAAAVTVSYLDRDGQPRTQDLTGLAAVVAQHEIDHLDGKTIVDRMGPIKRQLFLKAYFKGHASRTRHS